jgi:hypothetical protein
MSSKTTPVSRILLVVLLACTTAACSSNEIPVTPTEVDRPAGQPTLPPPPSATALSTPETTATAEMATYGDLGGFYTFDEWQALVWTDPNSGETIALNYDQDSIEADPQFIAIDLALSGYYPGSDAFRPAPGSACAEMGAYAGLP